jgi:hypothetical protein
MVGSFVSEAGSFVLGRVDSSIFLVQILAVKKAKKIKTLNKSFGLPKTNSQKTLSSFLVAKASLL